MLSVASAVPDWLAVFVFAMVPIIELRGALPFAVFVLHMPLLWATFWSALGSFAVAPVLLWGLPWLQRIGARIWPAAGRAVERFLQRSHERVKGDYEKYGLAGLAIFVAIPLPMTGVWTGAAAAYVLGLPKGKALISLAIGAAAAGCIVAILTHFLGSF